MALLWTLSSANSACHRGARHKTNASTPERFFLTLSTWVCSIPYAGSSSEWNIPATPANFAAPASSLPNLGICAPSSSNSFFPINPEKPGRGKAYIVKLEPMPFFTILESQFENTSVTSVSSNGNFSLTSLDTSFDSIVLSEVKSGRSCCFRKILANL